MLDSDYQVDALPIVTYHLLVQAVSRYHFSQKYQLRAPNVQGKRYKESSTYMKKDKKAKRSISSAR